MEEFLEEEILWPHQEDQEENSIEANAHSETTPSEHNASAPILIPLKDHVSRSWTAGFNYDGTSLNMNDDDDDDDGDDDGDDYIGVHGARGNVVVPPHLLIQQRNANKKAFSVCVGNGRPLKGRDLRVTLDSILRLTGFLEK